MRHALFTCALAATLGGCALSVESELEDIEVSQPEVSIPGVPPSGREIEDSLSLPIAQQVRERIGLPASAYKEVKVHEVRISAPGVDLSFIRSLRFTMTGSDVDAAPTEIARYDRTGSEPVGSELVMTSRPAVDVLDQWLSPVTTVGLEASGDLPDVPWTAAVVVKPSARLEY